ncbi:hypothetical protein Tco_1383374 [Tanacetum coccineum]
MTLVASSVIDKCIISVSPLIRAVRVGSSAICFLISFMALSASSVQGGNVNYGWGLSPQEPGFRPCEGLVYYPLVILFVEEIAEIAYETIKVQQPCFASPSHYQDHISIKKEKFKSLALKARKISSDEEDSCWGSGEEYAMAVRGFNKKFRRRGKFVRQPYDDKKNLRKVKEEKKEKEER